MSEDIFSCHKQKGLPLASSGKKPGIVLNILWCLGCPHDKEIWAPTVTSAEAETLLLCGNIASL